MSTVSHGSQFQSELLSCQDLSPLLIVFPGPALTIEPIEIGPPWTISNAVCKRHRKNWSSLFLSPGFTAWIEMKVEIVSCTLHIVLCTCITQASQLYIK